MVEIFRFLVNAVFNNKSYEKSCFDCTCLHLPGQCFFELSVFGVAYGTLKNHLAVMTIQMLALHLVLKQSSLEMWLTAVSLMA